MSWAYFAAVLAVWAGMAAAGDRWWLATVVLFGPRWVWALPLVALAPAAAIARPRSLWVLLNAAVVVALPVLGVCVPWRGLVAPARGERAIRVLTCNMGGSLGRPEALAELINATHPDIVALQEGSTQTFPEGFWAQGWDVRTTVASRFPIRRVERLDGQALGGNGFVTRFDIETPGEALRFFNVHLATPRDGLEAVMHSPWRGAPDLRFVIGVRADQSEAARRWIGGFPGPVVVAGDFNMPVEGAIYRRSWGDFTNAFSAAGWGLGHTKFTGWFGVRIDHVLAGPGWRCRSCWVGPDVGSDHRPVIADLVWAGASR
jgi:vancomycin resistance protein VanJ